MVENVRITKSTKKCTEYLNEACLRNARVSEGYKEVFFRFLYSGHFSIGLCPTYILRFFYASLIFFQISRLIGKEKDEADDEAEAEG